MLHGTRNACHRAQLFGVVDITGRCRYLAAAAEGLEINIPRCSSEQFPNTRRPLPFEIPMTARQLDLI
jgi:hypothetical protein